MKNTFVRKPIYIVGPTGSGKSALAMKLARILDGVIISADSMQIYKTLDINVISSVRMDTSTQNTHMPTAVTGRINNQILCIT